MNESRRGQILAAGLGLGIGLDLILVYFLGWQVGVPVMFLVLGSAFLLIGSLNQPTLAADEVQHPPPTRTARLNRRAGGLRCRPRPGSRRARS